MANMKIEQTEGIGPAYGDKLRAAGIADTDALLAAGKTRKQRAELADKSGIDSGRLLKWINMADLFRIHGVGPEYAELLEAAGVDTVKELRTRNAANLVAKMDEVNTARNLTRRVPSEAVVADWISQAGLMPPMIEH